MFSGVFTALITPMRAGKIDEEAFCALVEWQIAEGVHGLVPCGTTGECPTLSYDEHIRVIELCVEQAAGRVPVMAGTGSNSTDEAIMLTQMAEKAGADAALVVTPYYNKPTQEGLFQHYKAIAEATALPIFLYDVPARCNVELSDETMQRLADIPKIVGIKDATGELGRPARLKQLTGDRFIQLSGEDVTAVEFNEQGGVGCISVTSNIAPARCAALQNAMKAGDFAAAKQQQDALQPLNRVMFCETNPIPVKFAAHLMGKCAVDIRLPLVPPSPAHQEELRQALTQFGLI